MRYKHKAMRAAISAAYAAVLSTSDTRHRCCIGAAITYRNSILTTAHNSNKTHTWANKYHKYPMLHAEIKAMLQLGIDKLKGTTLYVARINITHTLSLSRPCTKMCIPAIMEVGIKHVFYTTDDKYVGYMQFSDGKIVHEDPKFLSTYSTTIINGEETVSFI